MDFLARTLKGEFCLYQVAYEINDEKTKILEERALHAAENELGIKGIIITRDNYAEWALNI